MNRRDSTMWRPDDDRFFVPDPRDDDLFDFHDPPWTKRSHPYCYDPFTIWGHPGPNKECNATDWTDRLSADHAKYDRLAKEIYRGCRPFDDFNCRGDKIEEFLRAWYRDDNVEIRLLWVTEWCDASTGYPTWRLDYVRSPRRRR